MSRVNATRVARGRSRSKGKDVAARDRGELDKLETKLGGEKAAFSAKQDAVLLVAPAKLIDRGEGGHSPVRSRLRRDDDWQRRRAEWRPGPLEREAHGRVTRRRRQTISLRHSTCAGDSGDVPAGAFGRAPPTRHPCSRPRRTIWTSGPQGTLQNAICCTRRQDHERRPGESTPGRTIDGKMHVTPGIIECHSHTAFS
jgi:hypothetical protein